MRVLDAKWLGRMLRFTPLQPKSAQIPKSEELDDAISWEAKPAHALDCKLSMGVLQVYCFHFWTLVCWGGVVNTLHGLTSFGQGVAIGFIVEAYILNNQSDKVPRAMST